jgi:dephospho-CoA kinase
MVVIGIAGGIASGKSLVAGQLQQLGAASIDVDRIGHEVLLDQQVKQAIRELWGAGVFDDQGNVHRPSLAKIVFDPRHGPDELKHLERITHPVIGQRLRQQIDQLRRHGKHPAVVLDAPVMFKAGWDKSCDAILFVDATAEDRRCRAAQRGWSAEQLAAREAVQEPAAWKRAQADFVVDNSGTIENTQSQVREFWERYVRGTEQ